MKPSEIMDLKALFTKPERVYIQRLKKTLNFKPDFDLEKEFDDLLNSTHLREVQSLQTLRVSGLKKEINHLIAKSEFLLNFLINANDDLTSKLNQTYKIYKKTYSHKSPESSMYLIELNIGLFHAVCYGIHYNQNTRIEQQKDIVADLDRKVRICSYAIRMEINRLVPTKSLQQSKPYFTDHLQHLLSIFINVCNVLLINFGNDNGRNFNEVGRHLLIQICSIIDRGTNNLPTIIEQKYCKSECNGTLFVFIDAISHYFNSPDTKFLRKTASVLSFLKTKTTCFNPNTGEKENLNIIQYYQLLK